MLQSYLNVTHMQKMKAIHPLTKAGEQKEESRQNCHHRPWKIGQGHQNRTWPVLLPDKHTCQVNILW